jgi:hypothetical protein
LTVLKRQQQLHSSAAIVKQHFAVSKDAHPLLQPLLSFAAPRRQIYRESFLDTTDFLLARNDIWLRLREEPNAQHRRWSLKICTEGGYDEHTSEPDILNYLRAKGYVARDDVDMLR